MMILLLKRKKKFNLKRVNASALFKHIMRGYITNANIAGKA